MKANRFLRQLTVFTTVLFCTNVSLAADPVDVPTINVGEATPVKLTVRAITRTMSDGTDLTFWVYCDTTTAADATQCTLPSPILNLNIDSVTNDPAQANFDLVMTAPWPNEMRMSLYRGHTIHPHGLDVVTKYDGVPETYADGVVDVGGVELFNYNFPISDQYVGSHMYHCHVHTVKHLEMGMYGAFVVKSGKKINTKPNAPLYDEEWIWVLSTVDPRYHTAVGDDAVFSSYDAKYFLVNGHESGRVDSTTLDTPSETKTIAAGTGKNLVIRLMGLHSLNATFQIFNADKSASLPFTVHNIDGFALAEPQVNLNSTEVSPGQTKDIIVTIPATATDAVWYPQVTYSSLRRKQPPSPPDLAPLNPGDLSFGTVYTTLTITP